MGQLDGKVESHVHFGERVGRHEPTARDRELHHVGVLCVFTAVEGDLYRRPDGDAQHPTSLGPLVARVARNQGEDPSVHRSPHDEVAGGTTQRAAQVLVIRAGHHQVDHRAPRGRRRSQAVGTRQS